MIDPTKKYALWIPTHRQEEFNADMAVCINEYITGILDNKQYYPQVIFSTIPTHMMFLIGNLIMYYGTLLDYDDEPQDEHIYKYMAMRAIVTDVIAYSRLYDWDLQAMADKLNELLQTNIMISEGE